MKEHHRPEELFDESVSRNIVGAIRLAELATSGEIRIYVETKCPAVEPLDRAAEIFFGLQMDKTKDRNAVLVYLATKHRQLAIYADEGIYAKTGPHFWNREVADMIEAFRTEHYQEGIIRVIADIGKALHSFFPYQKAIDKNELPDDIVFGD
jgi:uncharacterized membrane protein